MEQYSDLNSKIAVLVSAGHVSKRRQKDSAPFLSLNSVDPVDNLTQIVLSLVDWLCIYGLWAEQARNGFLFSLMPYLYTAAR